MEWYDSEQLGIFFINSASIPKRAQTPVDPSFIHLWNGMTEQLGIFFMNFASIQKSAQAPADP